MQGFIVRRHTGTRGGNLMEVVNCSDETLLKIRALYKADDNGCERVGSGSCRGL